MHEREQNQMEEADPFSDQNWFVSRTKERIEVGFRGRIAAEDGAASAKAFLRALGTLPAHVVFDVRRVEGYDGHARLAWQTALLPRRKQLRSLTVISNSALTRMGASVFALFLGIECILLREPPATWR